MTSNPPGEQQRRQIKITDASRMRALAHPARLAILDRLLYGSPATATECAQVVGLSPSATSYHLRALARAGLVEQAPGRGDARERLWRRVENVSLTLDAGLDASPETVAAERELVDAWLVQEDARYRRWVAHSRSEPPEWYDAATSSSSLLVATAEEIVRLHDAIEQLLEPLRRSRRAEPPAGARPVSSVIRLFPLVEVDHAMDVGTAEEGQVAKSA